LNYLAPFESADEKDGGLRLVVQIFLRWDPLFSWMRQIDLRSKAIEAGINGSVRVRTAKGIPRRSQPPSIGPVSPARFVTSFDVFRDCRRRPHAWMACGPGSRGGAVANTRDGAEGRSGTSGRQRAFRVVAGTWEHEGDTFVIRTRLRGQVEIGTAWAWPSV